MKFKLFLIFYSVVIISAYSQSSSIASDTVLWRVTAITSSINNERVFVNDEVITYGLERVVWIQKVSGRSYDFEVLSTVGTLSNWMGSGFVKMEVKNSKLNGAIVITKNANQTTIEFLIRRNLDAFTSMVLTVSNVQHFTPLN